MAIALISGTVIGAIVSTIDAPELFDDSFHFHPDEFDFGDEKVGYSIIGEPKIQR